MRRSPAFVRSAPQRYKEADMRGIWGISPGWGLTITRAGMAIILIAAGWAKMSGGMAAVAGSFEKMGIPMANVAGPSVAVLEVVGGILLLLGAAGRWFPPALRHR